MIIMKFEVKNTSNMYLYIYAFRKIDNLFVTKGMEYTRSHSIPYTQMEFQLVQNRKENCHHDYISFISKGYGCLFFVRACTYHGRNLIC